MRKPVLNLALTLGCISNFVSITTAQDTTNTTTKALTFAASYIGENANNLSGGIKTGSCYLGISNIQLNLDVEKAGLWKAGQLFINAANTHGESPSAELLGDMQVASNIDAGNHTYLQEVWFKQAFRKGEITVGLQDLNVEFANSDHGALFLNSSFGILPTISNNFAAPLFPLTTLGFTAKWNISEKWSWVNALYDGCPTDFDYNPYNVKWEFISGDGLLSISEYQFSTTIDEREGTYKVGTYCHSHIVEQSLGNSIEDSVNFNLFGLYTYADQQIWNHNNKSIGLFAQLGYSPSEAATNNVYLGMGMNYAGVFSKQGHDILGLAVAHEQFNDHLKSETTLEITYQRQITENIFIQPDFQYIMNPAGTGETLENSLTGSFRFGIQF